MCVIVEALSTVDYVLYWPLYFKVLNSVKTYNFATLMDFTWATAKYWRNYFENSNLLYSSGTADAF
jgi:hypothetical protein